VARESKKARRERAIEICNRMNERYPQAACALKHASPFELTIAVLLSAQTTDAAVNKVTPVLFDRWPTPADLAAAPVEEVEDVIRPIGFYHTKARNAIKCAQTLVTEFDGEVPRTIEEMQRLPGVGRKTANVVLTEAYGIVEGIAVDTHVFRITHKLRLAFADTPSETEKELLDLLPRDYWGPVNRQLVQFGREVCSAKAPKCGECPLADLCPSAGLDVSMQARSQRSRSKKSAGEGTSKKGSSKTKTL
jgi:endonuclease-3